MLQLAQNIQSKVSLHLVKPSRSFYPQKQRAFAVLYLPVTSLLRTLSIDEVLSYAKTKIKQTATDPKQLICVAIDYWEHQNTKLLNFLDRLFILPDTFLIPIGPSVSEALKATNSEKQLKSFFKTLLNFGICTVEGGNNQNCLEIAASEKFLLRPSFAVNINQGFTEALTEKLASIEKLSRYCNRVETVTIFPDKRFADFDNNILKTRSIQKYLNILRNSRRMVRSVPYLRAPISAFGNVMPEELAIKEVNDFGHFAINQETAKALGLEQLGDNYRELFL